MSIKLKNFLIIALKQAINAVLAAGILKVLISGNFHLGSSADWWNFGKAMASVITAREVTVWGPLLLKWTQTNSDPVMLARLRVGGTPPPKPPVPPSAYGR
jgi:hypothetical protein